MNDILHTLGQRLVNETHNNKIQPTFSFYVFYVNGPVYNVHNIQSAMHKMIYDWIEKDESGLGPIFVERKLLTLPVQ